MFAYIFGVVAIGTATISGYTPSASEVLHYAEVMAMLAIAAAVKGV